MRCPGCRTEIPREPKGQNPWRPFCSERCKLLDLGRWLDGSYAIPGEPASDEELEADLKDDDGPQRRDR